MTLPSFISFPTKKKSVIYFFNRYSHFVHPFTKPTVSRCKNVVNLLSTPSVPLSFTLSLRSFPPLPRFASFPSPGRAEHVSATIGAYQNRRKVDRVARAPGTGTGYVEHCNFPGLFDKIWQKGPHTSRRIRIKLFESK